MLSQRHAHARDAAIQFDATGHRYTIHDDSVAYTSVTSCIKPLFEDFDADGVIVNMQKSSKWSESKYFGMDSECIKALWSATGKEAASQGTLLHADIERYYNEEPVDNGSAEYAYFINFANKCTLTPYRTEWVVFHEGSRIAGTIDMVFQRPDGMLEIYDWKRCKQLEKATRWNKYGRHAAIEHLPDTNYWHYALQLNFYKYILESKYGVRVASMYLVCLHPSQKNYQKVEVCTLESEIADLVRARCVGI